jgi:HD superfamily phosphohydrolase
MAVTKNKMSNAEKEEQAKLFDQFMGINMMSSPTVNGNVIRSLHQNSSFGQNDLGEDIQIDLKSLIETMKTVSNKVKNGNLSNLEEMLVCQTYSLQHLFLTMASRISSTTNPDHIELFARFALKAQNQCRSTVATLSEMRNPKRATFVKQQNNAVNQQINQGENSKNLSNPANELLEKTHGERLDTRETKAPIGTNQDLETVGEVMRCKDE